MSRASRPPRPVRVCLVEGHDLLRALVTEQLTAAGLEVCASAATATGGLAAVRLHRPDVAVVDDHLPDVPGVELCAALTAELPGLAVVLHAATVDERLEVAGRAAGARAVVPKSVRGTALLDALAGVHPALPR